MLIKKFTGHSNCIVELHQENSEIFVRKISSAVEYNRRLKKQFIKQKSFISQKNGVRVPKIVNSGFRQGLFFFDMEYISGKLLSDVILKSNKNRLERLIDIFISNIPLRESVFSNQVVASKFNKKIESLKNILPKDEIIVQTIHELEKVDYSVVPETFCFGDLTTENIIVDEDSNLICIDLLDSFVNSWYIDAAKLLQDLRLQWAYRNRSLASREVENLNTAYFLFKERIVKNIGEEDWHLINQILRLNILRIFPYNRTEKERLLCTNMLEKLLEPDLEI